MRFLIDGKLKTHEIYKTIIQEELLSPKTDVTNLIQAFLHEKNKRVGTIDLVKFYNDQQFYHLLADIFGASLDTTLTTLRWYLLFIAVHKQVQSKIRQQLEQVLAKSPIQMEDVPSLPYLEASIAETQRIRSVVPVGIPHGSLEEMEIEDYKIPKGTMIVPLQWAIHMDPQFWDEPDIFRPDRFLNEDGKFYKPDAFIPFQTGGFVLTFLWLFYFIPNFSGKRMCVGDELARMFLVFFGGTLIQNFDISVVDPVDLRGDCGITLTPKMHKLVFTQLA